MSKAREPTFRTMYGKDTADFVLWNRQIIVSKQLTLPQQES